MRKFITLGLLLVCLNSFAQNGNVGIGTTTPNDKAILDLVTTDKGLMLPRLTYVQRIAMNGLDNSHKSLMVYQTDSTQGFYYFNGTSWKFLGENTTLATNGLTKNGDSIKLGGAMNENTTIAIADNTFNISTNGSTPTETLDQSQTTITSTINATSTTNQSFKPATSGYLSKITLNLKSTTTTQIRTSIVVSGTTYYSNYITPPTGSFADVDFAFSGVYLTANTTYSFNTYFSDVTLSYNSNPSSYTNGSIYFVSFGSGDLYFKTYVLSGSYSNNFSISQSATQFASGRFSVDSTGNITKLNNVAYNFPSAQGTANQVLKNDGSGNLTWTAPATGTVTNVTGTSPISVANNATTPSISIAQANTTTGGYLASTDWNTFNNKVASTTTISTTAPLTGGGDLSVNRTISIPQAGSITSGYISSTDWNYFNSKQDPLSIASATVTGKLASIDWSTFNNKYGSGSVATLGAGTVIGSTSLSYAGLGLTIKNTNNNFFTQNNDIGDGNRMLSLINESTTASAYSALSFRVNPSGGTNNAMLDMKYVNPKDGSNKLVYSFRNSGSFLDKFEMNSTGKLGINKTSPTVELDVNGSALISSLASVDNSMVMATSTGLLYTQPVGNLITDIYATTTIGNPISVNLLSGAASIDILKATTNTNGYLTNTDWNTFNNKQAALSNASTSVSGILTSTDWNTFNNKQAALSNASTSVSGILTSTDWNTFNNKQAALSNASTSVSGILTSTDWNTFNNKVATTRTISTTAPLSGGGDLSANRTLSIAQANTTTSGYLTSTDWNTFNNKANQSGVSNIIKTTVTQDIASIPATSYIDEFFTVSGAAFGSSVIVNPASGLNGGVIIGFVRVSAANTVQVRFHNLTASAINVASQDYEITVIKN